MCSYNIPHPPSELRIHILIKSLSLIANTTNWQITIGASNILSFLALHMHICYSLETWSLLFDYAQLNKSYRVGQCQWICIILDLIKDFQSCSICQFHKCLLQHMQWSERSSTSIRIYVIGCFIGHNEY